MINIKFAYTSGKICETNERNLSFANISLPHNKDFRKSFSEEIHSVWISFDMACN